MPYSLTAVNSGLIRTTGLPAGDYTCMVRYNFTGLPGVGKYRSVMGQLINATLVGNAITNYDGDAAIYSGINLNVYNLDVFFNDDHSTTTTTLTAGTQYILVYIRKGNIHYFFAWGAGGSPTLIASLTKDITAASINALMIGNDGGGGVTNLTVAYFRDWSGALSMNELYNESNSSRAIRTDDLVSDCPFESDLLDKSANGNNFSDQGTAGTFTTVVPTSDYTITDLPFSQLVPQVTFNLSNLVWFKYTNDLAQALGMYTDNGGTFTPKMWLYLADGISLVKSVSGSDGWFRIVGEGDYYIKVTKSTGGASNFNFTTQFDSLPIYDNFNIPTGALIVNDDTGGNAATVMSVDGTIFGFVVEVPGGELGAILGDGTALWHDRFNYDNKLLLLDPNFETITATDTTPSLGSGNNPACICANPNNTKFYVLRVADGKIWKLTKAGVLTDTGKTLPVTDVTAIGINQAETILYYARGTTNNIINKWDMVNNVALPALYTITGLFNGYIARTAFNGNNGEILVLKDDTIVTWYRNDDTDQNVLLHIDTDGTLLKATTFTGDYQYIDHINFTSGSANINIWFFKDSSANIGRFGRLALETGLTTLFTQDLFSVFINLVSSDPVLFGPSASCTMLTYIFTVLGGIYKITPDKRNDTLWLDVGAETTEDVKIPDPLARTALLGE